jgi:hypothetical protein
MKKNLILLASQAELLRDLKNPDMYFYYAKIVEHIAEVLRENAKDGDQADQLADNLNCFRTTKVY